MEESLDSKSERRFVLFVPARLFLRCLCVPCVCVCVPCAVAQRPLLIASGLLKASPQAACLHRGIELLPMPALAPPPPSRTPVCAQAMAFQAARPDASLVPPWSEAVQECGCAARAATPLLPSVAPHSLPYSSPAPLRHPRGHVMSYSHRYAEPLID